MEAKKPGDSRSELEEQLERAFYLHANSEFKQLVVLCRQWLGLPEDGLASIEEGVEWLVNHHWKHLRAIQDEAYREDGVELWRWSGPLAPSTLVSSWRPRLVEPSEEERLKKGWPPAFSQEGEIADWKEKHIKWAVRARFAPSVDLAARLIEDFALPPFMLAMVEAYIVSNDEIYISPAMASIYVMPFLVEMTENEGRLTARIGGISALTTQEDWLNLWHYRVKPALERQIGELSSQRRRSQAKWTRNLAWQRARRREKKAIREILEDYERDRSDAELDETTVGKAIARVDELMRPTGEETRRILKLFEEIARGDPQRARQ